MRNKEELLFAFSKALSGCIGRVPLADMFSEIVEEFEIQSSRACNIPNGDPVFWKLLACKLEDMIYICYNGYEESDLIAAGLVDISKED